MSAIVLYFHVHQPYRIKKYTLFDIGHDHNYFDSNDPSHDNQAIFKKVADKCYLPTNNIILDLLNKHPEFKVSFSLSGVFLDQALDFYPSVIESFQDLVATGRVELLNETYYHSLAFLHSPIEFISQIKLHTKRLKELFNYKATSFRNTELIYSDDIAKLASKLGFKAILAEGVDKYLSWRSPNYIYTPKDTSNIKLLLKNYRLSDDIAFRFSNKNWSGWPLTANRFSTWLQQIESNSDIINLFMDYETFGEHQWQDTGIHTFLHQLPQAILSKTQLQFMTVSQAADQIPAAGELSIPELTSWADKERDISAWQGNYMQLTSLNSLFALKDDIFNLNDQQLIQDWRRLTTSDHFYYMTTKTDESEKRIHQYFSPYQSPFSAYQYFITTLNDLRLRTEQIKSKTSLKNIQSIDSPLHPIVQ